MQYIRHTHYNNGIFIGFLFLLLIHLIFVFIGFYNNDDINYARYAGDIMHNGVQGNAAGNHYQLRWTVIYVTAFFYKLFGINAFTSSLCSFISVILCGVILKKVVHFYRPFIFILSLLLFFFAHSTLFYMHRTLPDSALCLAVLWMYFSYRSCVEKQQNSIKFALQFSLALLLAILTKETIIIVSPLFLIFFFHDLYKRKQLRFWVYAIPSSIILVFFYLLYFKITTGSFFYRYEVLTSGSYFSECSFNQLPLIFTLRRIGYELWKAMLLNGDMLIFIPALAAFIYRKKLAAFASINYLDFYSFVILLCCANLMTISFTSYVPLCHDPRHFLFLFPFAAIIGGPMLFAYCKDPTKFLLLPFFLIIATFAIFYLQGGTTKYLYLLFSLILIARFVLSFSLNQAMMTKIALGAIIVLFALNYLIDFVKAPYPYYRNHKKVVDRSLTGKKLNATVFSGDAMSGELTDFFLKFKTEGLRILPMDSVKTFNQGNLYYLIVGDLNPASQIKADSLVSTKGKSEMMLVDKEQNVFLYKVDNATLQLLKIKD